MFYKDNTEKRLFEVMNVVDRSYKPKLQENILSNKHGVTTVNKPIIPDVVEILSQNPKAVKFTDKQSYDEFANQQQYFSASHSHAFYSPEEQLQWSMSGGKYSDPDSEQSDILFETGREPVQVWDNKNSIGYVIPSERNKVGLQEEQEEFIPHGSYTVSNSGGYEIMLSDAGDAAKVRDAFGSDNPQTSDWLEIEYVPGEDGESEPVIDPEGYNIPLSQVMRLNEEDDKWIQKAVNPKHKGYCTPMTKDTCTPARKALAKRFKKGIEDENVDENVGRVQTSEKFGNRVGEKMWEHMMENLSDEYKQSLVSNGEEYQAFVKGVLWAITEESSQFGADIHAKNAGAAPDEMMEETPEDYTTSTVDGAMGFAQSNAEHDYQDAADYEDEMEDNPEEEKMKGWR